MYILASINRNACSHLTDSVSNSYNRCGFLWGKGEAFLLAGEIVDDFKFGKEKIH